MAQGWKTKKFGDVTRIANGQVNPTEKPYCDLIHVAPDNISLHTGQLDKNLKTASELGLTSGKYEFDETAIVYSKIRPNLNKLCIPRFQGTCSADMYPIWVKDTHELDIEYLFQYMLSDHFYKPAVAASMRTGLPKINREDLNLINIHIPPLPEQQKIAAILKTWDEAIEKTERLINTKQRLHDGMRERLYAECYHSKDAKKVKQGWTPTSFGQIFEEKKVRNPGLDEMSVITVGKYAIRKQTDHFTRNVSSKDLSNYWLLEPGDFVYDPMSAYYGALGRYGGTDPGIVSPAYRVISLKKGVNSDFVQGLLDTHYILFALEAQSSQGNKSGKRRSLQRGAFNGIKFFLPDVANQKRISIALQAMSDEMQILQDYLNGLKKQKRGLMQKLLTGEWRVKVSDNIQIEKRVSKSA